MSEDPLKVLSDLASEAHARIQQAHEHINPVVEVRQGMRDSGIPADVMTIDCLRTRRRIVLILHDEQPGTLLFEFIGLDEEPGGPFRSIPLNEVDTDTLFDWMQDYFSD
ncbi:hypothetical protein [Salicola sp. Rm-C-2C1-2]|uniref:hypothetical protein n=1 Tax=Salicola sp. Rm-C-2C1-2 TaxID=3141321 RepID=UPI0032E37208